MEGVNITARVAAIIGLVSLFINPFLLLSAAAIITGVVALELAKRYPKPDKGYALTGIVAGLASALILVAASLTVI